MMNSLVTFLYLVALPLLFAEGEISLHCKEQVKEVQDSCDKSSFNSAYAGAINQIPYDFKLIFTDMEKCTKAVALCYYNCKNKTLSKSSGLSSVLGALKKSYGKKPHTAEVINCRGSLASYAQEVEGTCDGQFVKLKSEMDEKDEGLKELNQKCGDFLGFEDPEPENFEE